MDICIKSTGMNELDDSAAVGILLSKSIFSQLDYKGTFYQDLLKINVPFGKDVKIRSTVNPLNSTLVYFIEEGAASIPDKIACKETTISLEKLVTRVPLTEEIGEDVEKLPEIVFSDANESLIYKIEHEVLLGTHSIHGIMTTGMDGTIVYTSSSTPEEDDLISIVALLHPQAKKAKWYLTKALYTYLTSLVYTAKNALTFENGEYYLFGYQLVITPQLVSLPYNLLLADFSRYAIGYMEPKYKLAYVDWLNDEKQLEVSTRICGSTMGDTSELDDGEQYGWYICTSAVAPLDGVKDGLDWVYDGGTLVIDT